MTSHKEWLAQYHQRAEQARHNREAQNCGLNTEYLRRAACDEELVKAFETGEARSKPASQPASPLARQTRRFISNNQRRHPVSPDKAASRRRKRKWGGSSCLPDWMREHYTEGERAALAVVVQQVKRFGFCDLAINAIAALAGVHRTTVQNALRQARERKHVAVQERPGVAGQLSMTNVIRILCGAWKGWLRRVGSGFKKLHPSEMKVEKNRKVEPAAAPQGAYEGDVAASGMPSQRRHEPMVQRNEIKHGPNRSQWRRIEAERRPSAVAQGGRGVVSDFALSEGTGGGRFAQ